MCSRVECVHVFFLVRLLPIYVYRHRCVVVVDVVVNTPSTHHSSNASPVWRNDTTPTPHNNDVEKKPANSQRTDLFYVNKRCMHIRGRKRNERYILLSFWSNDRRWCVWERETLRQADKAMFIKTHNVHSIERANMHFVHNFKGLLKPTIRNEWKKGNNKAVQSVCVKDRERERLMCITSASENNGYYVRFIKIQRMKYARFILFPFRARYKQNGVSLKHCKIFVNRALCAVISFSHTKLCAAKILSSLVRSLARLTDQLIWLSQLARRFFSFCCALYKCSSMLDIWIQLVLRSCQHEPD